MSVLDRQNLKEVYKLQAMWPEVRIGLCQEIAGWHLHHGQCDDSFQQGRVFGMKLSLICGCDRMGGRHLRWSNL